MSRFKSLQAKCKAVCPSAYFKGEGFSEMFKMWRGIEEEEGVGGGNILNINLNSIFQALFDNFKIMFLHSFKKFRFGMELLAFLDWMIECKIEIQIQTFSSETWGVRGYHSLYQNAESILGKLIKNPISIKLSYLFLLRCFPFATVIFFLAVIFFFTTNIWSIIDFFH